MNLKAFAQRRTISKVKRQPSEWEKITANEATESLLLKNVFVIYIWDLK